MTWNELPIFIALDLRASLQHMVAKAVIKKKKIHSLQHGRTREQSLGQLEKSTREESPNILCINAS